MKSPYTTLACPVCQETLTRTTRSYKCSVCRKSYPVRDGVISLMPEIGDDVILSKGKWEDLHGAQTIALRTPEDDETIASYLSFLRAYKKKIKKGRFLDLGCGIAWTSYQLAKQGIDVTGVDITRDAIEKSNRIFAQTNTPGTFIQGNLLQLPFHDRSFSFIYSCMSLEYVADTQAAINEAYRIMQKNGTMIAIVPVISLTTLSYHQLRGDIPNIPIVKQAMKFIHLTLLKGSKMAYGYEQSFRVEQLRMMFTTAGFNVRQIEYFPMHYPISFIAEQIRPFAQTLLKFRPFWPLVYVEARS